MFERGNMGHQNPKARPISEKHRIGCISRGAHELSPTDISRDVRPESRHAAARWSVHGYVALMTDETARSGIENHDTKELQVAVGVIFQSVRKKTGGRLRV